MKTTKKLLPLLALLLIIAACSTPPIALNYSPTTSLSLEGQIAVGDFRYIPGESEQVKPNQIRNTAIGKIFFEQNIDEYIETALKLESKFAGIKLSQNGPLIYGEVKEFLIDDLGFSVTWTLDIHYVIDNCYDSNHSITKKTGKFGDVFGHLRTVIRLNIDELFSDPVFVKCIAISDTIANANNTAAATASIEEPQNKSGSDETGALDSKATTPVTSKYPRLAADLDSDSAFVMRNAAKKIGEERLFADEGLILASIALFEKALRGEGTRDKYYVDGLAWTAINLGKAKDKRASDVLAKVIASSLPRKVRSHAIQALKRINK